MHTNQVLILFDGVCNLCNSSVCFLIRIDAKSKLKFGTQQSQSGQEILKKYNIKSQKVSSIILVKDDNYFTKSSAILSILKILGGGFYIIYFLLFIIPRPIRDYFYDLIAKNRYRFFGKRESCMVPPDKWKDRFI